MSNGKPIASDLDVLEAFAAPFIVGGISRDDRCAAEWGCHVNQVYSLWSRRRFRPLLDSGVSVRSGWLTPEGRLRLAELRGEDIRATEAKLVQLLRAGRPDGWEPGKFDNHELWRVRAAMELASVSWWACPKCGEPVHGYEMPGDGWACLECWACGPQDGSPVRHD